MWVIMAGVRIVTTKMIIAWGSNAFQSTVADLGTKVLNFGFTEDTVKVSLVIVEWTEGTEEKTYIQVLLEGDL